MKTLISILIFIMTLYAGFNAQAVTSSSENQSQPLTDYTINKEIQALRDVIHGLENLDHPSGMYSNHCKAHTDVYVPRLRIFTTVYTCPGLRGSYTNFADCYRACSPHLSRKRR